MNLRSLYREYTLEVGMVLGMVSLTAVSSCNRANAPAPKPALDFGQTVAVELCKLASSRPPGFDPALCQAGSDFLRPFVDDAAKQFAASALADRGPTVASTPCPPFADGPAPVPPGTAAGGARQ